LGQEPRLFDVQNRRINETLIFTPGPQFYPPVNENPDFLWLKTPCPIGKRDEAQQAQVASRPVSNQTFWVRTRWFVVQNKGSIRLLFSAELRPIHLSQSLTFVAQDILPPLKERRRQQAQVTSRQTKSYRLGTEPDVLTFRTEGSMRL